LSAAFTDAAPAIVRIGDDAGVEIILSKLLDSSGMIPAKRYYLPG
jgi:hypothetical protein